MTNLYPFKFTSILKEKVWGGNSLVKSWGKSGNEDLRIGESWELSGLQGDQSVISNGFLEGNSIEELIEVYMGDLVGEDIYEKYGNEFPLLIKIIDAADLLSIQVHPDDSQALKRHSSYGKNELWYILDTNSDSVVYAGFKKDVIKEEFLSSIDSDSPAKLLNKYNPVKGDSFFIPTGTIHTFGNGVVLVEIQQTSDITYRVSDWGRVDSDGVPRELHTELAIETINFNKNENTRNHFISDPHQPVEVSKCDYFTVTLNKTSGKSSKDYTLTDSFIIYFCLSGSMEIESDGTSVTIEKGETILIPAISDIINLDASTEVEYLEIFIELKQTNN